MVRQCNVLLIFTKNSYNNKMDTTPLVQEGAASASAVGLRYVSESSPGFTRKNSGSSESNKVGSFDYYSADGVKVTDPKLVERFQALGIPPAYSDVWISPYKNSHLQATGVNEKGKKQYMYHPDWVAFRTETNHLKMIEFAQKLPLIRRKVKADLEKRGLVKEKVLATIVSLLDMSLIRVGNENSASENEHYGLTTMRNRHVSVQKDQITFAFRGKSGKDHEISIRNKKLSAIVKRCVELPGWEVFQYVDESGEKHSIDSGDVNDYLKEISCISCSAKDFRTWWGTVYALVGLGECSHSRIKNENQKAITAVVKSVSAKLGNTPTVCRKHYIYPKLFDHFDKGKLKELCKASFSYRGLTSNECCALAYLQRQVKSS